MFSGLRTRLFGSGADGAAGGESKGKDVPADFTLPPPIPVAITLSEEEHGELCRRLGEAGTGGGAGAAARFEALLATELTEAHQEFKDDKIFAADSRIKKMRLFLGRLLEAGGGTLPAGVKEELMGVWRKRVSANELCNRITKEVERGRKFLEILESDEGWCLSHKSKKMTAYWREEKGADTFSFKVAGVVSSCILNLIPLLLETHLFPQWFPMMTHSEEIASLSRFHKIVRSEMGMPFPLRQREVIIDGRGWDAMEHNRIVVTSSSIESHPEHEIPSCPEDKVRVDIKIGGFELIPIDDNRTYVTIVQNLNPHIPYIPSRIINFFLESVVGKLLPAMEKHSKFKKGSPYLAAMAKRAETYNYIERRFHETKKMRASAT